MKRKVLRFLRCPNSHATDLHLHEIAIDASMDDVLTGVLVSSSALSAYPIEHGIAVLLSDQDTEPKHHIGLLQKHRDDCPPRMHYAIDATIQRLTRIAETQTGKWNREEMDYYDARDDRIENPSQSPFHTKSPQPDWSRLLLRQRALFRPISATIAKQVLVEIGCGTAKTIARGLNPATYAYDYIGIELSWQRLLHARAILPQGTFLQASAMNLPLRSALAHAALAFGALHHMADPIAGLREMVRILMHEGYLGFHEPIRTRKLIPEGTRIASAAKRVLESYQHSEHDNDIDYAKAKEVLASHGFRTVSEVYCSTVLGYVLGRMNRSLPVLSRARATAWLVQQADMAWARTIGARSERLGPRGVVHLSHGGR